MKNLFSSALISMTLVFFSSFALADWTNPVSGMEVLFGCSGVSVTALSATNVSTGASTGEVRLPSGMIAASGSDILFQDNRIGVLSQSPLCAVQDTSEPATSSWIGVNFDPGVSMKLHFQPDYSSCRLDDVGGGALRTNHYTLSLATKSDVTGTASWQQEDHYDSPQTCLNTNL